MVAAAAHRRALIVARPVEGGVRRVSGAGRPGGLAVASPSIPSALEGELLAPAVATLDMGVRILSVDLGRRFTLDEPLDHGFDGPHHHSTVLRDAQSGEHARRPHDQVGLRTGPSHVRRGHPEVTVDLDHSSSPSSSST